LFRRSLKLRIPTKVPLKGTQKQREKRERKTILILAPQGRVYCNEQDIVEAALLDIVMTERNGDGW
jgi:hypothetical protein